MTQCIQDVPYPYPNLDSGCTTTTKIPKSLRFTYMLHSFYASFYMHAVSLCNVFLVATRVLMCIVQVQFSREYCDS